MEGVTFFLLSYFLRFAVILLMFLLMAQPKGVDHKLAQLAAAETSILWGRVPAVIATSTVTDGYNK